MIPTGVTLEDFNTVIKLYELHVIKEKITLFERKYKKSFEEFEKEVFEKENFEKWDDYMEWKAYLRMLEDLERKN
ncbi:MAG: hypothetical protein LWW94_10100 [Candidatus Desulfofervidaceae bacterium]|nr:hypothetical protein [Candidatus Desulfofervidaceae bacterium]